MIKKVITLLILVSIIFDIVSQSLQDKYEEFKKEANKNYASFRDECNKKYVQFLIDAWEWFYGEEPTPVPDDNPISPKPYEKEKGQQSVNSLAVIPLTSVLRSVLKCQVSNMTKPKRYS